MRRNERAVIDIEEILGIMEKCEVCSLALSDGAYPYVVPVNFGVEREKEGICLYFHGSGEGTKMELLKKDNRVAFCMTAEEETKITAPACGSTMYYKSVCGRGRIDVVEDTEAKLHGLTCIMRQYDKEKKKEFDFNARAVEKTVILRLTVEQLSGKINRKPEREA